MQIILDQNPSLSLSEQALVLPFSTPEEMLADLQNAVSEDFPVLSGIAYEVKTVDDSLKDFFKPRLLSHTARRCQFTQLHLPESRG